MPAWFWHDYDTEGDWGHGLFPAYWQSKERRETTGDSSFRFLWAWWNPEKPADESRGLVVLPAWWKRGYR